MDERRPPRLAGAIHMFKGMTIRDYVVHFGEQMIRNVSQFSDGFSTWSMTRTSTGPSV
jgi:hypothetical protein